MMSQDDLHRHAYLEEARELLTDLEASLLELERLPHDADLLHKIFRALHTIKGSGAMFGFDDIADFTHDVESVFDRIRNGILTVNREILDLSLQACDHIRCLLEADDGLGQDRIEKGQRLLDGFRAFDSLETPEPALSVPPAPREPAPALGPVRIFRLRVKPHAGILATGNNPLHLLEDLHALGDCSVYAHHDAVGDLASIDPCACLTWWDCVLRTEAGHDALANVFVFVEDECDLTIDLLDDGCLGDGEAAHRRLGEILIARGDITPDDLEAALANQQRLGDILVARGAATPPQVISALAEQEVVARLRQAGPHRPDTVSSLRVAADKLDALVDLVGELVIVQSQIRQAVEEQGDPRLRGLAEHLERLSNNLRDSTLSIRMLPIGTMFAKFHRLVRDLTMELGKNIDLVTSGEETELDKTVIERLSDPLVHLLRNSIDHGVERPDVRRAAGKPEKGTIRLSAAHAGGEVRITVADDGAGLDAGAIRARAEQRGLVPSGIELSPKELYHLIFLPGFSTARTVTNISGRGVGMDVVKRAIDALRGTVDIDSEPGRGTVISVRLPLTLAIIDGLQIQVGAEYYVVPLALVEECVELPRAEADAGRGIVNLRGEAVPCLRLRDFFGINGQPPPIEPIVMVTVEGGLVGIAVDRVVGEHQTVIKSLGRLYRNVEEFSGATIKGDGAMALILDVPALVRRAAQAEEDRQ